jgi:hypothetical protein
MKRKAGKNQWNMAVTFSGTAKAIMTSGIALSPTFR